MPIFNVTLVHRIFRATWIFLIMVGMIALCYYGFLITYPFLIAWLFAYMLNPLIRFLEQRWKLQRNLAVITVLLLLVSMIALILYVFVTKIIVESWQITSIVQNQIAEWREHAEAYFYSDAFQQLLIDLNKSFHWVNVKPLLSTYTSTIAGAGTLLVTYLFTYLKIAVLFLPKLAVITVVIMVATLLISKQWNMIAAKSATLIPVRVRQSLDVIINDLRNAIFGYMKGHIILSAITAFVFFLGLLVLRVEYALTIAIIGGVVDLIPLVGIPAIIVPWALFAYLDGNVWLGTGLLIMWPIILVTRHAFEPKVYGTSIGLHPLLLLIFLFMGLKLFGIIGIFIGIIILVVLTALHKAHVFRDLWRYIMTGSFFEKEGSTL